jgi:hypothetical protein
LLRVTAAECRVITRMLLRRRGMADKRIAPDEVDACHGLDDNAVM